MSFVVTDQNRYIGEHTCEREHYGDMSTVRQSCIDATLAANDGAKRYAFTSAHPNVRMLIAFQNHLTDSERAIADTLAEWWKP